MPGRPMQDTISISNEQCAQKGAHQKVPARFSLFSGLFSGSSVPPCLRMPYWACVRRRRHSSSLCATCSAAPDLQVLFRQGLWFAHTSAACNPQQVKPESVTTHIIHGAPKPHSHIAVGAWLYTQGTWRVCWAHSKQASSSLCTCIRPQTDPSHCLQGPPPWAQSAQSCACDVGRDAALLRLPPGQRRAKGEDMPRCFEQEHTSPRRRRMFSWSRLLAAASLGPVGSTRAAPAAEHRPPSTARRPLPAAGASGGRQLRSPLTRLCSLLSCLQHPRKPSVGATVQRAHSKLHAFSGHLPRSLYACLTGDPPTLQTGQSRRAPFLRDSSSHNVWRKSQHCVVC